ncbi:MAG: hemagglutinin repeat-containing protein, partial [Neisseriaceae bacterium]|nr:hemagglutinin repeat-containing protein [Neisseriaceae bacterium]
AQAVGDINFVSKGDGNYRAVNINSQNGKTQIVSREGKISVEEGRATNHIETRTHSQTSSLLSSKTEDRHYLSDSNEALHSNITGKNAVIIGSRGDVNIVGANIVSGDESDIPQDISGSLNKQGMSNAQNNAQHKPKTVIYSENGNININAAENRYYSESEHQVKKSGLLGTGGIGITIGTQKTQTNADNTAIIHSGSQIGSLKGDTTIYAGKTYTQTGSTVLSAGGETTISGSQVDIKAAQNKNEDKYRQRFEQKGITVSVSSTLTDFAQTAVNVAKSAEKIGQSKNDRVNAMAAMNSVYSAYGLIAPNPKKGTSQLDDALASGKATAQNLANGNLTNAAVNAWVKLAISYGQQKSQSESNTKSTTAQASEVLGESVNITARENDINIIGSDVSGSLNTDLTAANNINIKSFKETESNRSNNQASGLNAGIALAVGAKTTLGFDVGAKYGKGHENADSTTQRNSHIGSQTGQTNISTGETLNIKGGQVQGQGIQINAKDLNIESQQDTETYHSRQRNASGSISFTGVMPTSGSLNAGQSKINADYASVNEQSGIFAGNGGYQINIKNHTDLKGGLITSSQKAEDNGKNQFTTGSLNATDIQNHALYKGESFAVGIGANYNGEEVKVGSNGIGYGNDSDSHHSITKSGINTANIVITDKNKQKEITGKSAEETIQAVKTDITTDNYAANQGSLKNNFDANRVQSEIDLGVEVMQDFSRNVQDLHHRQNQRKEDLKVQLENNEINQDEYDRQVKTIDRQNVALNMIAGGLLAPTDSVLGVATSTLAPAVSYQVGQYFKEKGKENSFEHIATHAVLGAITAQTNGGNALSGAISAGGAEYIAQVTAQTLFQKDAKDLTADEKQTVSSIAQLVGVVSGSLNGNSLLDAYVGGTVATNAVENNALIRAIPSAIKILYKAKKHTKKGKISGKDLLETLKKEGVDIADDAKTLFDGELTWDDVAAIVDLVIGTELNDPKKKAAIKEAVEKKKKSKGSAIPHPDPIEVRMRNGETLIF